MDTASSLVDSLKYEDPVLTDYHSLINHIINWKKKLYAERPFFDLILKKNKVKNVLELDCAAGNMSVVLRNLQNVELVLGIDSNPYLIKKARSRDLTESGIAFENIGVDEINKIAIKRMFPKYYDCILDINNSIATIINDHNLHQRLKLVKEHLSEEGIFILSTFNYNKLLKDQDYDFGKILFNYNGIKYNLRRDIKIIDEELVKYTANLYGPSEKVVKTFEQLQIPWTKRRLINLLESSGFTIEEIYGDFAFNDFNVDLSKKIIIISKKKIEKHLL